MGWLHVPLLRTRYHLLFHLCFPTQHKWNFNRCYLVICFQMDLILRARLLRLQYFSLSSETEEIINKTCQTIEHNALSLIPSARESLMFVLQKIDVLHTGASLTEAHGRESTSNTCGAAVCVACSVMSACCTMLVLQCPSISRAVNNRKQQLRCLPVTSSNRSTCKPAQTHTLLPINTHKNHDHNPFDLFYCFHKIKKEKAFSIIWLICLL